jgi:activator of 2-hydroxyglutaryl-CoA dehydratase
MRLSDTDEVSPKNDRFVTAGVDIGMRAVKVALLAHGSATGSARVLTSEIVIVPNGRDFRAAQIAVRDAWFRALRSSGLLAADVALVASTGREHCLAHVGHFYRGSSLTAGVRFLFPRAIAVLDVGARQLRCTRLETPVCGRGYAATPKDESWGGDVLEAISRTSDGSMPEAIRSSTSGAAYEGVAARAVKLMHALSLDGPTAITGGMALDARFLDVLARRMSEHRKKAVLLNAADAVFAGAYGAALLAAQRLLRAARSQRHPRQSSILLPSSPARRLDLN